MKKCPSCAESIQDAAIKCRFCGASARPSSRIGQKVKANEHPNYWTYTLISILLPIIGIILGIIGLTKNDELEKKLGEHALALSIVLAVLYAILFPFLGLLLR